MRRYCTCVYELAERVLRWRSEGRPVVLLRAAALWGASTRWSGQAMAVTVGQPPVGTFLAGSLDRELTALAQAFLEYGGSGQIVDLPVDSTQAMAAGLTCAGSLRALLHPASDLPSEAWAVLAAREPICLVTDLSGHNVWRTTWFTLETLVSTDQM